jgi:hypothetical protein
VYFDDFAIVRNPILHSDDALKLHKPYAASKLPTAPVASRPETGYSACAAPGQTDADAVLTDDRRCHHRRLLVPASALPGLPHNRRRRPAEARLALRRGRDGPYPGAVVPILPAKPPFAELVCLSKSSVAEGHYAENSGNRWVGE